MYENGAVHFEAGNNRWISTFWRSFPLFGKEQGFCLDDWSGNCLLEISPVLCLNEGKPCKSPCCGLCQLPLPRAGTVMALTPSPGLCWSSAPPGKEVPGLLSCLPNGPLAHCKFKPRVEEEKSSWFRKAFN